ncbi:MAG: Ppx/GppA family phosphatase [Parvularculales bacterium]
MATGILAALKSFFSRETSPVGVVDIGSNSVRLVIYRGDISVPVPLFNERVLCGLGRTVVRTGSLDKEGVALALEALRGFSAVAEIVGVGQIFAVATAAIRDAHNGDNFVAAAEETLGTPIRQISGVEEAHLAARGVLMGMGEVHGIVGDLGGGSLELAGVIEGRVTEAVSFPLGVLRLMNEERSFKKITALIDKTLSGEEWLSDFEDRDFYAVGGTWRNLARLYMYRQSYPLHALHQYAVSVADVEGMEDAVAWLQNQEIAVTVPNVSRQRVPTFPFGLLVLSQVLARQGASRVVFSDYGLREGVLAESVMPVHDKDFDPLMDSASLLAARLGRHEGYGEEVTLWCAPLFAEDTSHKECVVHTRLRRAACLMSDIGWAVHADDRAMCCVNQIVQALLPGIDHMGRAFLAAVLFYRHETNIALPSFIEQFHLIDKERAQVLGYALRLADALSASIPGVLPRMSLKRTDKTITLSLPPDLAKLGGGVPAKRLRQLAKLLKCEGGIETAS